jgi:diacylglycerol O-acyltransferase / wax synthase
MDERLTSIEAIMWRAGQDSALRMTIGNLMLLDHLPDRAAVEARLTEAAERAPRLKQHPDDPTLMRARPAWVEDADYDGRHHLRIAAVPSPGDQRQLLDLLALLEPSPFDPNHSPWDATLIEGLAGGRAAFYLRAHHTLTDGMGGTSLVASLLDDEAVVEAAEPESAAAPETTAGADADSAAAAMSGLDELPDGSIGRRPGTVTVTLDLTRAAGDLTRAAGAAMNAAAVARNVDPFDTVVRAVQKGLDTASSVSRQVVVAGGPLSPLPAARSAWNRFEVVSVPGARATALSLGGSRNDLLVAAAAAGLGAYQERLGLPASELRLAMPAGRHRDSAPGGNWFAPTRVAVPTSGEHPGPLFGVVSERLARARSEPAVRVTSSIAAAVSRLPARVLVPALVAQARSVDFVATAFPGLRGTRTLCGAKVVESYPFGPRLGCLLNITGFGNGDRLDVGLTLDPIAIEDPDLLLECLSTAFQAFAPKPEPAGPRSRAPRS